MNIIDVDLDVIDNFDHKTVGVTDRSVGFLIKFLDELIDVGGDSVHSVLLRTLFGYLVFFMVRRLENEENIIDLYFNGRGADLGPRDFHLKLAEVGIGDSQRVVEDIEEVRVELDVFDDDIPFPDA